jgi:MFS family permease
VVAFVLWELRADQPLLDPRLFRLRGFGTGSAGIFVMFLAIFGFMLVAMQFLQLILGYSPLKSAVALLPQMLLMIPLSAVAAQLATRFGQKRLTALGLLVSALGMVWYLSLDAQSGYWEFFVGMLLVTVGVGLAMTPATTAIVASLPLSKQGVASAVNDTAREVGAALGVAILGSAFSTAYRGDIEDHLGGLPDGVAEGAREAPAIALQSGRELGAQGGDLVTAAQDAFVSGFRASLVLAGVLLAAAAVYTWWRGPSNDSADADAGEAAHEPHTPDQDATDTAAADLTAPA